MRRKYGKIIEDLSEAKEEVAYFYEGVKRLHSKILEGFDKKLARRLSDFEEPDTTISQNFVQHLFVEFDKAEDSLYEIEKHITTILGYLEDYSN